MTPSKKTNQSDKPSSKIDLNQPPERYKIDLKIVSTEDPEEKTARLAREKADAAMKRVQMLLTTLTILGVWAYTVLTGKSAWSPLVASAFSALLGYLFGAHWKGGGK